MDFLKRWKLLWPAAPRLSVVASYARWLDRYNEPHRAYHTVAHIEDCLNVFDTFKHLANDARVVEAAIWWHDLIYETRGRDKQAPSNELMSAEVALTDMGLMHCSAYFQACVMDCILATKHDSIHVLDRDQQLVVDIDLHTLGAAPAKFEKNSADVRKEYEFVPWDLYVRERIKILERFLDRERIYYLPEMREAYEAQARTNLKNEIFRLRSV